MTSCNESNQATMRENAPLLLRKTLTKVLQWNRDGAACLEAMEPERALELFSMALSGHERVLELFPMALCEHDRARSRHFIETESPGYGQSDTRNAEYSDDRNNVHIEINIGINISRDMGNWFTRDESNVLQSPETGQYREEEREEDLLCCEPIRLSGGTETSLVRMLEASIDNKGQRPSNDSVCNAMSLLTTIHAYNLGLANHLCGLRLLRSDNDGERDQDSDRSGDADATTPRDSENASKMPSFYFIQAGQMYDFARRMEHSRSRDDHHYTNRKRGISEEASRIVVILACLTNLADLFQRNNQITRCVQYYRQVKVTATEMLEPLNLRRQTHQYRRGDEYLLHSYLRAFLSKAREGLSRLRRRNSRRRDSSSSSSSGSSNNNNNSSSSESVRGDEEHEPLNEGKKSWQSAMQSLHLVTRSAAGAA